MHLDWSAANVSFRYAVDKLATMGLDVTTGAPTLTAEAVEIVAACPPAQRTSLLRRHRMAASVFRSFWAVHLLGPKALLKMFRPGPARARGAQRRESHSAQGLLP